MDQPLNHNTNRLRESQLDSPTQLFEFYCHVSPNIDIFSSFTVFVIVVVGGGIVVVGGGIIVVAVVVVVNGWFLLSCCHCNYCCSSKCFCFQRHCC